MKKERSAYLFQKYIDKKCSAAEQAELMELLNQHDNQTTIGQLMDDLWDETAEAEMEEKSAIDIFNYVVSSDKVNHTPQKKRTLKLWWSVAAAVMVIVCAGIFMFNQAKHEQMLAQVKPQPAAIASIVEKTLNEHKKVILPDGSTVILNNNSSITYQKFFTGSKREVVLQGEGYFDVKHDPKKAFIVYAGKVKTTVLGTAFNVKAYDLDKNIEVTVTRGKVSVLNGESVLGIITPNQQVVFNKDHKKSNLTRVIAKKIVQWQESDIFFDDITMEQAAQDLSKRFNTNIGFSNDKVKKCKFTATFLKGESLDEILKVICTYNNAQYQTTANGITIKGEGCE